MDRAEALALTVHREGRCPLCGRPVEECTADEAAGAAEFVSTYATCRATLAIVEQQRAVNEPKPHPAAAAFLWSTSTRR